MSPPGVDIDPRSRSKRLFARLGIIGIRDCEGAAKDQVGGERAVGMRGVVGVTAVVKEG